MTLVLNLCCVEFAQRCMGPLSQANVLWNLFVLLINFLLNGAATIVHIQENGAAQSCAKSLTIVIISRAAVVNVGSFLLMTNATKLLFHYSNSKQDVSPYDRGTCEIYYWSQFSIPIIVVTINQKLISFSLDISPDTKTMSNLSNIVYHQSIILSDAPGDL